MESDSSFLSSFSFGSFLSTWFSFNQAPKESELISYIRTSKNEFESLLQFSEHQKKEHPYRTSHAVYNVNATPLEFWQYYYHHKVYKYPLDVCFHRKLEEYHEEEINGYSVLGASMIAKDVSIEEKRNCIQELINRGFKPTSKDMVLANLYLYDGMLGHQKIFLHLSHAHSQADWSVLPQEVRKLIAQHMIQLFKKEFWLLPETSVNNL